MIQGNTIWSLFIYRDTQYRNPHQSSVTTSLVTDFILRTQTGTTSATANTGQTRQWFWKKSEGELTGKVESRKGKNPGSRRSVHGYILTCSRRSRENVWARVFDRGVLNFCVRSAPLRGNPGEIVDKETDLTLFQLIKSDYPCFYPRSGETSYKLTITERRRETPIRGVDRSPPECVADFRTSSRNFSLRFLHPHTDKDPFTCTSKLCPIVIKGSVKMKM